MNQRTVSEVRILSTKKHHAYVEWVLASSDCETMEHYADKNGIEAAAKLATFSRALLMQDSGKWTPPWTNEQDYRSSQSPLYHWWIDCLGLLEEMTGIDYQQIGRHWDEILVFVRQCGTATEQE